MANYHEKENKRCSGHSYLKIETVVDPVLVFFFVK